MSRWMSARFAWIALVATLLHAFAPLAHAALAHHPNELPFTLCTVQDAGVAAPDAPSSDTAVSAGMLCPWCLSGAGIALAAPDRPLLPVHGADAVLVPRVDVEGIARPAPWPPFSPRAPPAA